MRASDFIYRLEKDYDHTVTEADLAVNFCLGVLKTIHDKDDTIMLGHAKKLQAAINVLERYNFDKD